MFFKGDLIIMNNTEYQELIDKEIDRFLNKIHMLYNNSDYDKRKNKNDLLLFNLYSDEEYFLINDLNEISQNLFMKVILSDSVICALLSLFGNIGAAFIVSVPIVILAVHLVPVEIHFSSAVFAENLPTEQIYELFSFFGCLLHAFSSFIRVLLHDLLDRIESVPVYNRRMVIRYNVPFFFGPLFQLDSLVYGTVTYPVNSVSDIGRICKHPEQ